MTAGYEVHVPGHITGFFTPHPADDPLVAGSRGAGITLADAVMVRVSSADRTTVIVDGSELRVPAVDHVLGKLDVTARIEASLSVPLGAGFGVSGALALGTAFGANLLIHGRHAENELVRLAHAADVIAGTGLGDVVAQHRGGAPIRLEPGAPGIGTLDGIPQRRAVEWLSLGDLSTEDVLTGDTTAIEAAGDTALERLRDRPTLDRFMDESAHFAREAALLTDELEEIIETVESAGGRASMAMLGQTVFALDDDLSNGGFEANRHEMGAAGVRILQPKTED